jgi:membrane-bound ClpP family serine protease
MDPILWSILLLLVGLLLLASEVFVPSGGVLGFLSMASTIAAIVMAFYTKGVEAGVILLCISALAIPATLVAAFRWWPKTPMGKRLLLDIPKGEDLLPDSPERRQLRSLVGKTGVAGSVMLPSGVVTVEGLTVDALTEGIAVEVGTLVRVIDVRGNRVVVQPVGPENQPARGDDVLSQPIESLGLDPFDEPLA